MLIKVKAYFRAAFPSYFCDVKGKNSLALVLIFSSIILLLVLQAFWLQKVYRDEREGFEKETITLFRSTLFQMNDSLLEKSIVPMWGDSQSLARINPKDIDSVKITTGAVRLKKNTRDTASLVHIFVSSTGDSLSRYLKPMASKIREHRFPQQRSFTIQLRGDSLRKADVEKKYKTELAEIGIKHSFSIIPMKPLPFARRQVMPDQDIIMTPSGGFQLTFADPFWLIMKKITPQILFSVFLTLLTIGSFVILFRSLRMQQRLMALKNDFISNITHELKTPVTTVGVAIEALKNFNGLENPKLTSEYLDIAQNELNRLTILTDKILKTAIFENKGVDYTSEPVAMDRLTEQVLNSMRLVFDKQQARIEFDKKGSDFGIMGGSVHLTSVVYNLLDNALKYSPVSPNILVTLTENAHHVVLSVQDNGIGIAPEYKNKVFEKFFRVPTGDVHNIKGYGLGLSYVQSVVKSHKGMITVTSEPGKGSVFTVTLPKPSGAS